MYPCRRRRQSAGGVSARTATAHGFRPDGAFGKVEGGAGKGKKTLCEARWHRTGSTHITVAAAAVGETTPNDDLKVGETGPWPNSARHNADQDRAEWPGLVAHMKRQDEGDRHGVGGVCLDPNRCVSLLGSPIEDEQMGMEAKRKLARDKDPVIEASASDQSASANRERLAAVDAAQPRLGADRQPTSVENFSNKEEAMVAALDSGSSQMLAAALPAFRRASDWSHAVHDTQEAMFSFGVQEPEYARLGAVEMYAAGKRALEQREVVTEGMEGLLAPGYELKPDIPPITAEAIGGALYALFYDHVKQKGAERLAEMVPLAVYVTLAPFLGAEEAYALAIGEGGKG